MSNEEEYGTPIQNLIPIESKDTHDNFIRQIEYEKMQQSLQNQYVNQSSQLSSDNDKGDFFSKIVNLSSKETFQSIFIIVLLFIILNNCYFKQFCVNIPFLTIENGDFNFQSLVILGFLAGITYIFIKNFII